MGQSAAIALYNKYTAALQSGDKAAAEAHLRACVAEDPDFVPGLLNLGIAFLNGKAYQEAEPLLRKALHLKPSVETITAYAVLCEVTNHLDKAEQCYRDILKALPDHLASLKRMGDLCDRKGDRRGARAFLKRAYAADPADTATAMSYAVSSFADDPAETAAIMDKLVAQAGSDSGRLKVYSQLLFYKEFHERKKRGLMPFHGTSLDELFFTYCAKDFADYCDLSFKLAAQNPTDAGALIRKFTAQFCARDRKGAQETLIQFQPLVQNHVWTAVTFDPAFYRKLESMSDADLVKGLPPLIEVLPATFREEPVAYLSCNYSYYAAFAVPMIRSLADKSPGAQLHVHIMDATDEQLAKAADFARGLPLTVGISAECPGVDQQGVLAARAYYHAIRFIRYYQHLQQYRRTLWLMDVDALFNRDPREMYKVLGSKDAALRIRAGRFEPWNQFNACIVAASPSAPSVLYHRLIAAYIADFHQRDGLRWGIDQLAQYGVHAYLHDEGRAPDLAFLDDKAIDYDYLEDGIVWCNSGKNKFNHLKRAPDGTLIVDDPDRANYLRLFDKYYVPEG
jgi:tetratricopeptide (TPR) repeat protein